MPKLILIKHAAVDVAPELPPDKWRLSEKGRAGCQRLADALSAHLPFHLFASEETKAIETAGEIARPLQLTYESRPDLEEHDRTNVPVMRTPDFISSMELFFRKPGELVLGKETAHAALSRFQSAIDEILTEKPEGDVAIVSHGTVIALMLAHATNRPAFRIWRRMGLPSFAILAVPGFDMIEQIDRV